ncbi:MAG: Gfo/Idh/MocA family oxidoreductase [Kiritimatiellaeota bacterium]|nr:Gfo/Idh/MocA family oxidoreductase [Kiritimatiellota bacterium]
MTIQVGILGFAHGHVNAYCSRWREHPEFGVTVTAGWDHDAARLEKAASGHGVAPCTTVEALLERRDVEAVVVASETSLHADLVEQAARAGKAVVLQKPIALTLAEADRIVAAIKETGVPFTMAWQMRVDPQNLKIKELLDNGELGQVFMARRRHGLSTHLWPWLAESWHVDPRYNRDIWADDAAHAVDFIYWLFGKPLSVTAEIESLYSPKIPMDNGIAIYRYAGGPLTEVVSSFTNPAGENTVEIVCEKGTIIQNYGDGPSCGLPRPEGAPGLKWYLTERKEWVHSDIPTPPGHGHRIAGLAGPIGEFLRGERDPIATAEEGRTVLRMILACYVSTRQGRRVDLDDPAVADV